MSVGKDIMVETILEGKDPELDRLLSDFTLVSSRQEYYLTTTLVCVLVGWSSPISTRLCGDEKGRK